MNSITLKAYAKINLGLDVLRKREDGYHDVCMIMQTIQLYDTLVIKKINDPQIVVKTNLPYLPTDQRNLVYRTAALFMEKFHLHHGVRIDLSKKIPVAAGLAGGSTDAAAVLKGMNQLYKTNLSTEELMKLGVVLGADVPYCLMMGTALSEGIGEILSPLAPMPSCHLLLVKPPISVSTKYVYENLKLDKSVLHPDIQRMIAALRDQNLNDLTLHMDNILQTVTEKDYPVIFEIKNMMQQKGAVKALMSGSGPTVFGIFTNRQSAEKAYQFFKSKSNGYQVFLTKPYWPEVRTSS